MSDETDRPSKGRRRPPEFEEFRREMQVVVEQFQRDYDALEISAAGGAPAAASRSPWDRIRAFFTFRNVSLALNVVFVLVILAAARDRYQFSPYPLEVQIDQFQGKALDETVRELVIVREFTGESDERETIWARSFEGIVVQASIAPWTRSALDRKPRYLLVASLRYGKPGTLSLWDIRNRNPDRQMLWEHEVTLAEMAAVFPSDMTKGQGAWCNGFTLADLDGDDEPEVAAIFHHDQYFPACIRTLERDGSVRGTYWNWGYFDAIVAEDMNRDGRDEIIASGTNNVFNGGTIVMLDADHLSGMSMDEGAERRLSDAGFGDRLGSEPFVDSAVARIVFPMWHEEVAGWIKTNRIHATSLAFIEDPRSLMVHVGVGQPAAWKEARAASVGEPPPVAKTMANYWVGVQVGSDLRPIDMIVPDGLIAEMKRGRDKGKIRIRADLRGHWEDWLASYLYFGPAGVPDAAPLP